MSFHLVFLFYYLDSIAEFYMRVEREDVSETAKGFITVPLPPPLTLCLQISSCILREAVVTALACKAC